MLESLEPKIEVELKPILKALKEKIDSSKENFELTDSALKNYYNSIMSNLTMAMNDISNLNGDVKI